MLASGFLTPVNNSNDAAFGLFAVPATGSPFVALPAEQLSIASPSSSTRVLFTLAPNPVAGVVNVEHSRTGDVVFNILDAAGCQVPSGSLSGSRSLEVADLAPGLYMLQLCSGNASGVSRFVKQ